jgi:hypothetical protein
MYGQVCFLFWKGENPFLRLTQLWVSPLYLFIYLYLLFIYSHVHTLFGSFLPPAPFPHALLPSPPQFQAVPILSLSLILLKKRHKHNKEDKAFLLVELGIAIQKYS